MNDITTNGSSHLPAGLPADFAQKMLAGIRQVKSSIVPTGGKPFFGMTVEGIWKFGVENNEIQPGSHWAVNVMTCGHGYVCWKDAKHLGEVMVNMMQAKPPMPAPINGTEFKDQWSFDLKCLNGEDKGVETLYKVSSGGGGKAVKKLLDAMEARWQEPGGTDYPCPIVEFSNSDYWSTKYNKKIYEPQIAIVGWMDMNGNLEPSDDAPVVADPTPAAEAPKPKRKRAAVDAVTTNPPYETPPVREEPQPTAQMHTGQRRRPVAR